MFGWRKVRECVLKVTRFNPIIHLHTSPLLLLLSPSRLFYSHYTHKHMLNSDFHMTSTLLHTLRHIHLSTPNPLPLHMHKGMPIFTLLPSILMHTSTYTHTRLPLPSSNAFSTTFRATKIYSSSLLPTPSHTLLPSSHSHTHT